MLFKQQPQSWKNRQTSGLKSGVQKSIYCRCILPWFHFEHTYQHSVFLLFSCSFRNLLILKFVLKVVVNEMIKGVKLFFAVSPADSFFLMMMDLWMKFCRLSACWLTWRPTVCTVKRKNFLFHTKKNMFVVNVVYLNHSLSLSLQVHHPSLRLWSSSNLYHHHLPQRGQIHPAAHHQEVTHIHILIILFCSSILRTPHSTWDCLENMAHQ